MKYSRQVQGALNKLDRNLLALNRLIKQGKQAEAIQFMEHGALKEAYSELENIIILSQTGNLGDNLGAQGTPQTRTL